MCFFALFKNSPQICSQRLHDSTLMILQAAGISSLNITGVYILFSRFAAHSVLTQTHALLLLFWGQPLFFLTIIIEVKSH